MATQVQTMSSTKTETVNPVSPPEVANVMSVGGGVGDDAVDVTDSTKPDNKVASLGVSNYNQTTTEINSTQNVVSSGGIISTGGSVMGVGGGIGDNAVDVTYSTKPNNPFASEVRRVTTTTTTSQYGAGAMNIGGGSVMGVGGGVGDNAADVTYSTKPDQAIVTRLQGVTTSKVLSPIINTTVRPTIVHTTTSTTNPV